MCFTSEKNIRNVVTDAIDYSKPIYRYTCEVVEPQGLIDHNAEAYTCETRDVVIAEVLIEQRFDPAKRWYEQKDEGAIRIISTKKLSRREK